MIFPKIFRRSWIFALLAFWVMLALNGCNPSHFKTLSAQVPQLVITLCLFVNMPLDIFFAACFI